VTRSMRNWSVHLRARAGGRSVTGMRWFPRVVLTLFFVAGLLRADPIPAGKGKIEVALAGGGAPLTAFTYKPSGYKEGPLLVVFHGVVRNAENYRDFAIPMADRFGVVLVAPLLDEMRFPEEWYQRAGLLDAQGKAAPRDAWMFNVVPAIVADARRREGRPTLPYYLIGHSAGAQFLVRLAAYQPGDARRIVAGNAGSLLFPSREHGFGYGLGGLPPELSDDAMLQRYFAAPLTLYLGTGDTTPRRRFDASEAAMKQGPHRLARNRACFELAQAMARERGWAFNWRKVETPGIEHDAAMMFAAPEVEDALFGPKR
jgi:poly(3-hydroxybutyrate) depolymerase